MRLSIVTKIILLFSAVIAVFMAVSYFQVSRMSDSTRSLYEINLGFNPLSKIITKIDTAIENQQTNVERAFEIEDPAARRVIIRLVSDYFPRLIRQNIAQAFAHCDKLSLFTKSKKQKRFYADVVTKLTELRKKHNGYQEKIESIIGGLSEEGDDSKNLNAALKPAERDLARSIKLLSLRLENEISSSVRELEEQGDKAIWAGIFLSLSALLVAITLAILSAFLLKPLKSLTEAAQRIGQGDYRYSVAIRSGDELGALAREFESMRRSLVERDRELTEQAQKLERSNIELGTLKIHYENIINNLWLPVLVTDVKQKVKTINPEAARIWGKDLKQMLGKSVADLPLENGTLGDVLPLDKIIKDKSTVVREAVKVRREDGELRRVSFTAVPFLESNRVKGLIILGEDVSDKLQMESSMLRSERMAAIGRVSAKIAHEIRNPLSSIVLNAEMLLDELDSGEPDFPEMKPLLQAIIREVERLHGITEDHLSFTRLRPEQWRELNLNSTMANVVDFYRAELTQRGVECRLDLADRDAIVVTDENQIVQVIHNLIKNAIEAMDEGGVLELKTETDGESCSIHVIDNGIGIKNDVAEKMFEPFFSTKEDGTGLGLALVQQFVNEFGGQILFSPSEKGGAHFTIEFPNPKKT